MDTSKSIFNRVETDKRLSKLERKLRNKCCAPCDDPLGEINWQTQMAEFSSLLVEWNGEPWLDGADGSFSVEGHAYFNGGTFSPNGADVISLPTGGTVTILDTDFNIIFQQTLDPGGSFTLQCEVNYQSIQFVN